MMSSHPDHGSACLLSTVRHAVAEQSIHFHFSSIKAADEENPWSFSFVLTPSAKDLGESCALRPLQAGDEASMVRFGREGLSSESRAFFAPYPWDSAELEGEFTKSITNQSHHRDLHYIAHNDKAEVVAHVFLWSACDEIPELGIAVADAWQGRHLGSVLLRIMEAVARGLGRSAIELTTMPANEKAFHAYRNAGYELLGLIRNPLEVDVTAAFAGEVVATKFCDERHMVLILDETKRESILRAMAAKRKKASDIFGDPEAVS